MYYLHNPLGKGRYSKEYVDKTGAKSTSKRRNCKMGAEKKRNTRFELVAREIIEAGWFVDINALNLSIC